MAKLGTFVWYDIMTRDVDAASRFYTQLFGWTVRSIDMGGGVTYAMLQNGDQPFGGLMALPDAAAPSQWIGYIGVPELAETVARSKQLGAQVHREPTLIPNVGRFALLADPSGAVFAWFQGNVPPTSPVARHTEIGDVGWAELMTADLPRVRSFYAELAGWNVDSAMDMGDVGLYVMAKSEDEPVAGMVGKAPDMPGSSWSHYINVSSTDETVQKAKALGAHVLVGPEDVPGMVRFALLNDPTGALFGVAQSLQR